MLGRSIFNLCNLKSMAIAAFAAILAVSGPADAVPPRVSAVFPDPAQCVSRDLDPNFGGTPFTQVQVTFDQEVTVPPGAVFAHTALVSNIPLNVAPLDAPTTTVTVEFDPVGADRLYVVVDFVVTNAAGEALDGEIADPRNPDLASMPSGDGFAGGQAVFEFHVLQGDVNCDDVISASDTVALLLALPAGCDTGHPDYDPAADLDTNGCIEVADLLILNRSFGNVPDGDGVLPNVALILPATLPLPNPTVAVQFDEVMDPTRIGRTSLYAVDTNGVLVTATADPATTDNITFEFPMQSFSALGENDFTVSNSVFDASGESLPLTRTTISTTDTDGDGIDDDGNGDGTVGNTPCTGGAAAGCDDNCPLDVNVGQDDSDVDGVGDVCDICPAFDDAADVDGDGIPDGCDNCPDTFNPAQESTTGSPDVGDACAPAVFAGGGFGGGGGSYASDWDGDGVLNHADLCPNTPRSEPVDRNGCAESQLDDDSDGATNLVDLCPNTPAGAITDENGCVDSGPPVDETGQSPAEEPGQPLPNPDDRADADGDNVIDSADQCPDTPPGTSVDTSGCRIEVLAQPAPPVSPESPLCGTGVPCGATGLISVYPLLLGLGWMKRVKRRVRGG